MAHSNNASSLNVTTINLGTMASCISLKSTEHIARVNMLYFTEKAATVAIVFLFTTAICLAIKQEVNTQFVKNKVISTSYATKQPISKLHCVEWCSRERHAGKCKIAGYNKYARACSLSMDYQHNLLDVADETNGVFLMEEGYTPFYGITFHGF